MDASLDAWLLKQKPSQQKEPRQMASTITINDTVRTVIASPDTPLLLRIGN